MTVQAQVLTKHRVPSKRKQEILLLVAEIQLLALLIVILLICHEVLLDQIIIMQINLLKHLTATRSQLHQELMRMKSSKKECCQVQKSIRSVIICLRI